MGANIDEIKRLIRGRYPIIWINSFEERRIMRELLFSDILGVEETQDSTGKKVQALKETNLVYVWSATQGLIKLERGNFKKLEQLPPDPNTLNPVMALKAVVDQKLDTNKQNRMVVIMRDLHIMMNSPMPARKLRDIAWHLAQSNKTVINIGPSMKIPEELQKEVALIEYDYPDAPMIRKQVEGVIQFVSKRATKKDKDNPAFALTTPKDKEKERRYKVSYTEEELQEIIKSAQGLTHQEILCAVSKSVENDENGEIRADLLIKEKRNIINKSEILEFWDETESLDNVGGNDYVKDWLEQRGKALSPAAQKFGLRPAKGCLLVGVQGCGKSMIAKGIAGKWKIPLIRLDIGKVFAGLVGSSEQNMRNMISQAEAMAPCVLWTDEIEKGLSGTKSSGVTDGGTTSRVFGTLIQWMQNKTKPVFVIATANDVNQLPPELLRKGRFDEIFFIDLPTEDERADIWNTHISKIGRDPKKFDIGALAASRYLAPNGREYDYSGSEIEEALNDTLFKVYNDRGDKAVVGGKGDINTEDILEKLKSCIPISLTADQKIKKIQQWGRKHARFASSKVEKEDYNKRKPASAEQAEADGVNIHMEA